MLSNRALEGLPRNKAQAAAMLKTPRGLLFFVGIPVILFLLWEISRPGSSVAHRSSPPSISSDTGTGGTAREKLNANAPWESGDKKLLALASGQALDHHNLAHNYALSEAQCDAYFPGLYDDIDDSMQDYAANGNITKKDLDRLPGDSKYTRAMIYDGDLYVIDDYGKPPEERTMAILSSLHRALVADPERGSMANIEFTFSRDDFCDHPETPLWCLTRYKPPVRNWIIPDFGFWSWPIASVGSYTSVQRRISELEAEPRWSDFSKKIPKLIWRGATDVDHDTRMKLVEKSKGKSWSDVEPISWLNDDGEQQEPPNLIEIEDHCKYQFIAHSEANTYSGRQKYIQNCNSVIVTHDLMWLQPFHRFLVSSGPKQNYVKVKKDYSDLDEKMKYYIRHTDEAKRIAKNSVETFRDRYLVPAAEACYWRKLVRAYGKVSFRPEFYERNSHRLEEVSREKKTKDSKVWRGTSFETYTITGALDRQPRRSWCDKCEKPQGAA